MVVVLGSWGVTRYVRKPSSQGNVPRAPRTIAVLPFRNLQPDPESQFLSFAFADSLASRLGYLSGLVVRPSSYVARYRDGNVDPRAVAQELHVDSIISGSYVREDGHLRVSWELVDVRKAEVLGRQTLNMPYDRLRSVQDRVAEGVMDGLRLEMTPQTPSSLHEAQNPLAYEFYLRGLDSASRNDYRVAVGLVEKAVTLDPGFALAWARLGVYYAASAGLQGNDPQSLVRSQEAFQRALTLDPQLPNLRTWMSIQLMETGDVDQAMRLLQEELRRDPNQPMTLWFLSVAKSYGGALQSSINDGERALELDPRIIEGSSFNSYLYVGEYQKFMESLPQQESARTYFYRGLCHLYMGNRAQAAEALDHALVLDGSLIHAKLGKALLLGIKGQPREGIEYLRSLEKEAAPRDGEMLYKLAQAYAFLGDAENARTTLNDAVAHRFYCFDCFRRDPWLAPLQTDPRFQPLLETARQNQELFKRRYATPWQGS